MKYEPYNIVKCRRLQGQVLLMEKQFVFVSTKINPNKSRNVNS